MMGERSGMGQADGEQTFYTEQRMLPCAVCTGPIIELLSGYSGCSLGLFEL